MSYPIPVTMGSLTDTHTTQLHPLGAVGAFKQAATGDQIIYARYMQNGMGATLAAGLFVANADRFGRFDTTNIGSTLAIPQLGAGIIPVSRADGDYGWVVFQGPLTAGQFQLTSQGATTFASSAAERWLTFGAAGLLATVVTSHASTDATGSVMANRLCAILRSTSAVVATGTASTGIIDVIWH